MPKLTRTLSRRQREIYDYVREFIAKRGYSPTVIDIAKHFKLSALSTVTAHLKSLEKAGAIVRGTKGALVQIPEELEAKSQTTGVVQIPFYGRIAAGSPIEAINDSPEYIQVQADMVYGDCYALQAKGDSMIEEGIWEGDLIVVRHCEEARPGQTVVALIDGASATVKKFFRRGHRIILEPANQRLRPFSYKPEQVQIQGVVYGVIRRYPKW
ncbi:MAG: transcriptional repressor LexA [Acidobacteriota bacterium]